MLGMDFIEDPLSSKSEGCLGIVMDGGGWVGGWVTLWGEQAKTVLDFMLGIFSKIC